MKAAAAVLLFVLCGAGITALFLIDEPVRVAIVEAQGKKWKRGGEAHFHGWVRKVGDWPWLMSGGAAGFALAWKMGNRRWMRIVAAAMIASTVAGMLANASRLTTGRTRPRSSPKIEQGFYGLRHEGQWLVGNSAYNSFPSGHTATAFGFAWPFAFASPLVAIPALGGAVLIAWSSLALGVHHPSDLFVSVLISLGVSLLVVRWVNARGEVAATWIVTRAGRLLRRKDAA